MTIEELYPIWLGHFEGVLEEKDLKFLSLSYCDPVSKKYAEYYECPCGEDNHVAIRMEDSLIKSFSIVKSLILNCFINDKQWLIKPPNIQLSIYEEEIMYLRLLERSDKLVDKITKKFGMSLETKNYLHDTHGIPNEIVESIWEMYEN